MQSVVVEIGCVYAHAGTRLAVVAIGCPGRKSDLIISGGFNIYPREIEEFLMEQPEVEEAAVVAEADRIRRLAGSVPAALFSS